MTCMWKWKTVCHAALPHEFMRLTPSAPRRSLTRAARRRAAAVVAARSASPISSRSRECSRGTTRRWPRVAGLMSMKATVRSSSPTLVAGISPATILQNRQSGSLATRRARLIRSPRMGLDRALMEHAVRHLASFERASASPGEREAAEWIASAFREQGLDPVVEKGSAHGGFWWPLGLLNAAAIVAAVLRPRWLGRLLAAAAAAAIVDDLDHRSRWFRRVFLPHRPTWNVYAEAGDRSAARTVLVVAHHDAAHGGRAFDTTLLRTIHARWPRLYDRFNRWPPLMWAVAAAPLLVAAGERRHSVRLALGAIAGLIDIARSPVAPGANDNLAAV